MPTVPLLDLDAQNTPLRDELRAAFDRVLASGRYILGPEVEAFESAIAEMAGARHGIGVSSGTDALLLALMALEIGPGDEVICPDFTFFATAGCVARVGATPVFADVRPDDFNLDVADAARRITPRTRAIIPVHLYGQVADMNPILELAREHGIRVIEDAAQSLGARYHGRPCGGIGDFGAFSFYPTKNLGGFGDSGMLVCNDDALAARARILRNHGDSPKYHHKHVGGNFRMDPVQAALLAVKLPHYDRYTQARQEHAAYYTEELGGRKAEGGGAVPDADSSLSCPLAPEPSNSHIWNQYTIRASSRRSDGSARDRLKQFLAERGIATEIYYPVPLHRQECFARYLPAGGWQPADPVPDYPHGVSTHLANEALSLPVYPELTREQLDHVIASIQEWGRSRGA